jgi:hypothetical protein
MTTKPALQKILKGILHREEEVRHSQKNARNNKSYKSPFQVRNREK